MDGNHHILSVLVENKFGVLSRISGLFSRRGYNIYSLAVSPTEDPRYSRMTVVVDGDSAPIEQVTKPTGRSGPRSPSSRRSSRPRSWTSATRR